MAYDLKYGYVETEAGTFDREEPVFILRARDILALPTLMDYYQHCKDVHSSPQHLNNIMQTLAKFTDWQLQNGSKLPD